MDSGASIEKPSSYAICTLCSKKFGSIKLLNRHKKCVHKIVAVSRSRECRIVCPMCEGRYELKTQHILRKHLEEKHAVTIELLRLQFFNMQEYESWKQEENIETSYSVQRANRGNDHKEVFYICNRSNFKGYQPKYNKRTEKSGGTIKIQGMCPSQLICRLYHDGTVSVSFWKTHAGHQNELRTQHLSTAEKNIIVEKLKSGVSVNKILEDARKAEAPELQRINLVKRDEITYIIRKHNINQMRDPNEMVTAPLKVRSANGKKLGPRQIKRACMRDKKKLQCLDDSAKTPVENSTIKSQNEEEIAQFLQKNCTQQVSEELKDQNTREVRWAYFKNWTQSLNDDIFDKFMGNIQEAIREADQAKHKVTNKYKMETPGILSNK